jgi:hypothetical protein
MTKNEDPAKFSKKQPFNYKLRDDKEIVEKCRVQDIYNLYSLSPSYAW